MIRIILKIMRKRFGYKTSKGSKYRTNILFVRPNFLMGIGSTLNVGGNYYVFKSLGSGEEIDKMAIENDWGVIGNDIREATKNISKKELQLQY